MEVLTPSQSKIRLRTATSLFNDREVAVVVKGDTIAASLAVIEGTPETIQGTSRFTSQ